MTQLHVLPITITGEKIYLIKCGRRSHWRSLKGIEICSKFSTVKNTIQATKYLVTEFLASWYLFCTKRNRSLFFFFFFFFFIDIIAKYVARTFQAAIQLALDMCTPCRVSLAHLSPCNTLRYNAGGKCVSFDWSFVPFITFTFHFPRNDSTRIDIILSVTAISWIFYETFVCSCNIKKMGDLKNEICPNSLESYF